MFLYGDFREKCKGATSYVKYIIFKNGTLQSMLRKHNCLGMEEKYSLMNNGF